MRASFPRPPRKPLNRSAARNFALLNQLGTPGLGSLLAGRRVAGLGQLLLALAGFAMVVGWFVVVAINFYNQMVSDVEPKSAARLGAAGALTFGAAWLWALFTSMRILGSVPESEPSSVPPRLR